MKRFNQSLRLSIVPAFVAGVLVAPSAAQAMGKAPSTAPASASVAPSANGTVAGPTCSTASGAATTAHPVRPVVLKPVNTRIFQLPNGATVDISADLNSMLLTAVAATSTLSPTDAAITTGPCDTHVELRATVSTLELNVFEAGLTFGYSPTGTKTVGTSLSANASTDVQVGTIAMDFSLWECAGTACTAIAATTSDHATSHATTSFTVNFGLISTGPQFVYNTALGQALRTVMTAGVNALSASARVDELPWSATVTDVSSSAGTLTFDAGTRARLAANQAFAVYAVEPSSGACPLYKAVAYAHTTDVNVVTSTATVEKSLDARGIKVGDIVMVRSVTGGAQ